MLPAISPTEDELSEGRGWNVGKYTKVICRDTRRLLGYIQDKSRWNCYPQIAVDLLRSINTDDGRLAWMLTPLEALQLIEADIMHPAMSLGESDAANQTG